jgi:hypothetical protein
MNLSSIVTLSDVAGQPRVKMDLPSPLRLGDKIALHFRIKRSHNGRSEILDVDGEFRITALTFEAGSNRQILAVEKTETGKVPSWRAVKKAPEFKRIVPPARSPRMLVV